MGERIVKIILFSLVASIFAVAGGLALALLNYDLSAKQKANDVRLAIERLKERGAKIEEFRRSENRLPTDAEVSCDWKPCPQYRFLVWHVVPEGDGTFSLTYHSLGVLFSPVDFFDITWHSRDGKTDRDGWDKPWRWHLRYYLIALIDIAVILFPWGLLVAVWAKGRQRRQVAAH